MRQYFAIIIICISGLNAFSDANSCLKENLITNTDPNSQSGGFLFRLSDSGTKRTVFMRMEKNAEVPIDITNDTGQDLSNVSFKSKCDNNEIKSLCLPSFQNKEIKTFHMPVDTNMRPDKYIYGISVTADGQSFEGKTEYETPVFVVKRNLSYEMPVVLWATPDFKLAKNLGFTHTFLFLPKLPDDSQKIFNAKKPLVAENSPQLDAIYANLNEALVENFGIVAIIEPHRYNPSLSPYYRVDRAGKNYSGNGADNVCGFFEDIQKYYYNVGASIAQTYGAYPSLVGANINTEIRDHANMCFHPHDLKAYKAYSGKDIPKNINNKFGIGYTVLENFPARHIIPDDDETLNYLKWYWQDGDGWNKLTTLVHKGLKSTGRNDIWTFTDPAIRVPSISGSGGEVDAIDQWTYCYPNPIKIGKATDELFAMASLSKTPQSVFKMTQAIWYRSEAAPKDDGITIKADWERKIPDAAYITIPPDCLREAFWTKMARNIRGVMYHGLGSITDMNGQNWGYEYTNPETKNVIKELADKVVKPLGPTLLQIPEINSDVAFLQSFTSQMYAGVGDYGWGEGWENDAYEILTYAHLQPTVIFDEHIVHGVLDNVKVLVLINCPVLTESVAQKINKFQRSGGLIIADENICFGVNPDILMKTCRRPSNKDASVEKEQLQKNAKSLRQQLDKHYIRYIDSNNDDVLVRVRRYLNTDYVFTINDNRAFGDYVGHHKLVMEKGLPSNAVICLNREQGYVYDLKSNKEILPIQKSESFKFPVELGPGDGSVFMVTNQKIDSINLDITGNTLLGSQIEINISILDPNSEQLKAVIPCYLEIVDPRGNISEFSGYYGAKEGKLKINYDIADNDLAGEWKVVIKELASGIQKSQNFYVKNKEKIKN